MPKKQYERFTLSMDPKNADAVLNAKQLDLVVRRIAAQLLTGNDKLRSTERYRNDSLIQQDYYLPKGTFGMIKNALGEELNKLPSDAALSFSSASPVSMSSWTGSIMDARTRANVARVVDRVGGSFSTDDNGVSSIMIDRARQARNSRGQFVNAYSYLTSMIRSSNERHASSWEELMSQANVKTKYDEHDDVEHAAMASAAKSEKARRARREVTIANEKEETYARLESRRRKAEHARQYEIDNPDDLFVARKRNARMRAARSKRRKAALGAGKFAYRFVVSALAGMLAFLGLGVGLLNKIKDMLLTIGGKVRDQNVDAQTNNLSVDVVQNWERFAAKRGYEKKGLTDSIGELRDKFANPIFYSSEDFSAIAPFIKEDTAKLASAATSGDETTMLKMEKAIIKRLTDASRRGEAGGKTGLKPDEAYSENLGALRKALPKTAYMFEKYWYDTKGSVDFDSWRSGDMNPEYQVGTIVHNKASRKAAENTRDAVGNFVGSYGAAAEDILRVIAGYLNNLVELVRGFAGGLIEKYAPELALQERKANAFANANSKRLVELASPALEKEANSVLSGLGITMNATETMEAITKHGGKGLTDKQLMALRDDPNKLHAIANAAEAQEAATKLDEAINNGNKFKWRYDPATAANGAGMAAWGAYLSIEDALANHGTGVELPGGGMLAPGAIKAMKDPKMLKSAVAEVEKTLAVRMSSLKHGMNGDPSSVIKSAQDDLNTLLYYYASSPGHDEDVNRVLARIDSFQDEYGGNVEHVFKSGVIRRDLDRTSQDKVKADARAAVKMLQDHALGGLDNRAGAWETIDSDADKTYDALLKIQAETLKGTPSILLPQAGSGKSGASITPSLPSAPSVSATQVGSGMPSSMVDIYASKPTVQNSGQGDAGNVTLIQTIDGKKNTTTVPLKRAPDGSRVGDLSGNTGTPYIEAINKARNVQTY